MASPSPTKKSGEPLDRMVELLNAEFGFGLPSGKGPHSPSKRQRGDKRAEAFSWMRVLFWCKQTALQDVLKEFRIHAKFALSGWVSKPSAETDVLPRRDSNATAMRELNVPFHKQDELLDTLIWTLKERVELEKRTESATPESPTRRRSSKDKVTIESWVKKGTAKTRDVQETASEEKMFVGLTNIDIDMKVLEESFRTPAQSASEGEDDSAHMLFEKNIETIAHKVTPTGKKRTYQSSQSGISEEPRKLSRGSMTKERDIHRINTYVPAITNGTSLPCRSIASPATVASVPASVSTSANVSFTTNGASFTTEATSLSFRGEERPVSPQKAVMLPHQRADGGTTAEIEEDEMEIDSPTKHREASEVPLPVPADSLLQKDLQERLLAHGLIGEKFRSQRNQLTLRVQYETTRVALYTDEPLVDLEDRVIQRRQANAEKYGALWHVLSVIVHERGKSMPERCSEAAWKAAEGDFVSVAMDGVLRCSDSPNDGQVLKLHLQPLKVERSYRLKRKFGGHRFFHIGLPGLEQLDLPKFLRSDKDAGRVVRAHIEDWLETQSLDIFGRTWKPFYTKSQSHTPATRKAKKSSVEPRYMLYLFAESGRDFHQGAWRDETDVTKAIPYTVPKMLNWLIDVACHPNEYCLKLYARIALGVSPTIPTHRFKWRNIIRSDDAYSGSAAVRRLDVQRSNAKKAGSATKLQPSGTLMNDGCARMSRKAASIITDSLALERVPSAFQGRIGGAKGLWFVDSLDEEAEEDWIEVTDSQLKYDWHKTDHNWGDDNRLTFEVSAWSKPFRASRLNYQFMPILINRGIAPNLLEKYAEEDIQKHAQAVKEAKESARALACWVQENPTLFSYRKADCSVETVGAFPRSLGDQLALLARSGFHPLETQFQFRLLYSSIKNYMERVQDKMNIGVSCSAWIFCMADPLGVLQEGEVHLGFSGRWDGEVRDEQSRGFAMKPWSGTLLNNQNILVGRSPAHLPSDIQRAKAVFKSELACYTDVIIFSSKGSQALADMLSGGDYDGDKVWACWDPGLANSFQNFTPPPSTSPNIYGMRKDTTRVRDLGGTTTEVIDQILRKCLRFGVQPEMLGVATNYLERLNYECWHQMGSRAMEVPDASEIALMVGHLVDSTKGGLTFTRADFEAYLKSRNLNPKLKEPAYKSNAVPKKLCHPIDEAKQQAIKVGQAVLSELNKELKEVKYRDADLLKVLRDEEEIANNDEVHKAVLDDLRQECDKILNRWRDRAMAAMRHSGQDSPTGPLPTATLNFTAHIDQLQVDFERLGPRVRADETHPVILRWQREHANQDQQASSVSGWRRLRASMLYSLSPCGWLPWVVAGHALCSIKALASPHAAVIAQELNAFMKVDTRMVRREQRRAQQLLADLEAAQEGEDDELDEMLAGDDFLGLFRDVGLEE